MRWEELQAIEQKYAAAAPKDEPPPKRLKRLRPVDGARLRETLIREGKLRPAQPRAA